MRMLNEGKHEAADAGPKSDKDKVNKDIDARVKVK